MASTTENQDFQYIPKEHDDSHELEVIEAGLHEVQSSKKEIWKVFFILLVITALEFLIALTPAIRDNLGKGTVIAIFLFLTVLKAFYIVGYFMHLKHERINMAYTILLPIIFILYLIALLLFEGRATTL
ncbi:MAG: cytochrome C oxidase subunit IV family protein [Bacteroidota bacterium]|nr:cytochrome C oxidase subunit IV family protein [Bacteroidota bacterium]